MTTSPTQGEHAQPEALRLADSIEHMDTFTWYQRDELFKAATELRRLHAQVAAQPAAPQGGAYAELPASLRAMAAYPLGHCWDSLDAAVCVQAAAALDGLRASNGQAPAVAGAAGDVHPRHPVVVKWRNNGIEACAGIAEAYGCHDAALDMRAMLTAAPAAQPAPAADLPPLPEPDLRDVGTTPGDIKDFLRGYATEYAKAALAARAPADSVTAPAAGAAAGPLNSIELMKAVMQADEALAGRCTRGTTNWAAAIGEAVQSAVLQRLWKPEQIAAAKERAKKFEPWLAAAPTPAARQGGALIEALEIGLECAQQVAAEYHEAYKGHRPDTHAALDADVEKVKAALAAALAQKEGKV